MSKDYKSQILIELIGNNTETHNSTYGIVAYIILSRVSCLVISVIRVSNSIRVRVRYHYSVIYVSRSTVRYEYSHGNVTRLQYVLYEYKHLGSTYSTSKSEKAAAYSRKTRQHQGHQARTPHQVLCAGAGGRTA